MSVDSPIAMIASQKYGYDNRTTYSLHLPIIFGNFNRKINLSNPNKKQIIMVINILKNEHLIYTQSFTIGHSKIT